MTQANIYWELIDAETMFDSALALWPLSLTPLLDCLSAVTRNYFYISFLFLKWTTPLSSPCPKRCNWAVSCVYIFFILIYKSNLILVWVYISLYVYEWVYVEADIVREDGYFCESKIDLASAGLKGKNCIPFSVSP